MLLLSLILILLIAEKRCESSGSSCLESVHSDSGEDLLGKVVGGPFEGTLKTVMTPKLRLYFEERLEAMVTRILRERGLELHSRDPLPSGSNPSSIEGYAHGSFSMLHTRMYLFTLMLSVILQ